MARRKKDPLALAAGLLDIANQVQSAGTWKPNPLKVGISVVCSTCGRYKSPRGRSDAMERYHCHAGYPSDEGGIVGGCAGYWDDPKPGSLFPGESEEDFGYPAGVYGVEYREAPHE